MKSFYFTIGVLRKFSFSKTNEEKSYRTYCIPSFLVLFLHWITSNLLLKTETFKKKRAIRKLCDSWVSVSIWQSCFPGGKKQMKQFCYTANRRSFLNEMLQLQNYRFFVGVQADEVEGTSSILWIKCFQDISDWLECVQTQCSLTK